MKKTILFINTILLTLSFFSCNIKTGVSMSNPEDTAAIQQIIADILGNDSEVYILTLSNNNLSSSLNDISREYQHKDVFFRDTYYVKDKKFLDPSKRHKITYKNKKIFKVKEADIANIPVQYSKAILLLRSKKLIEAEEAIPLTSYTFEKDRNGNMTSEFTLQYYINTQTSGRVKTTNYGEYKFEVDENNGIILKE